MLGFPAGLCELGGCKQLLNKHFVFGSSLMAKTCQTCYLHFALYARECVCVWATYLTNCCGKTSEHSSKQQITDRDKTPLFLYKSVFELLLVTKQRAWGSSVCMSQGGGPKIQKKSRLRLVWKDKLPSSIYLWLIVDLLDPGEEKMERRCVCVWFSSCCCQGVVLTCSPTHKSTQTEIKPWWTQRSF